MQIVILGMHRSGTSALTRTVNLMGAYVGSEESTTLATAENPAGFWERKDVRALCDGILHGCGLDWWRPVGFDPSSVPDAVRQQAVERWAPIRADLDAHGTWVIKEPRLCLVLPVLRPVLDAPFVLHAHREPVEVASSLQTRNGFPLAVGLALWEHYTVTALQASADLPRTHVWYGDLLADTGATLARLHAALNDAGEKGLEVPPESVWRGFLSEQLYRERRTVSERHSYLTLAQRDLLAALQDPATDVTGLAVSSGAADTLRSYAEDRLAATQVHRELSTCTKKVKADGARLSQLEREIKARDKHDQDNHERLRQLADEIKGRDKHDQDNHERLRQLQDEIKARDKREQEDDRRLQQMEKGLDAARTQLEGLVSRRLDEQRALQTARSEMQQLKNDYVRLRRRRSVRVALGLARLSRPAFVVLRRSRGDG